MADIAVGSAELRLIRLDHGGGVEQMVARPEAVLGSLRRERDLDPARWRLLVALDQAVRAVRRRAVSGSTGETVTPAGVRLGPARRPGLRSRRVAGAATVGSAQEDKPGRRSGVPGRWWTYSSRPEPSASARRQRGQAAHHDGPAQAAARTSSATTRND